MKKITIILLSFIMFVSMVCFVACNTSSLLPDSAEQLSVSSSESSSLNDSSSDGVPLSISQSDSSSAEISASSSYDDSSSAEVSESASCDDSSSVETSSSPSIDDDPQDTENEIAAEFSVDSSDGHVYLLTTFSDIERCDSVEKYEVDVIAPSGKVVATGEKQSRVAAGLEGKGDYTLRFDNVGEHSEYTIRVYPVEFNGSYREPFTVKIIRSHPFADTFRAGKDYSAYTTLARTGEHVGIDGGKIAIDVKFTSAPETEIALRLGQDWDKTWGYFFIRGDGSLKESYPGVKIVPIGDGYFRYIFDLTELNTKYAGMPFPDEYVDLIYSYGPWCTATGFIEYVVGGFVDPEKVETHIHTQASEITRGDLGVLFDEELPNFHSSDKHLVFDYKATDGTPDAGSDVLFTLWNVDWNRRYSDIITVDVVNNSVNVKSGTVTATGDGWYRVDIPAKDIPINSGEGATGSESIGRLVFYRVDHAILFDGLGFVDEGGGIESGKADITFSVVPNTAQIKMTDAAPASPVTTLSFSGAKGERETGQLVLYAGADIINKAFDITFSDFFNSATGAVIGSDAIETYIVRYVNVDTNFMNYPEYDLPTGYYPDALLPLSVAIRTGENKLNVSNGNNQGLFFILNIPEDAAKGDYKGTVTVTVGGEAAEFPVEIEVFGFSLPEENAAMTIFGIDPWQIYALYDGFGSHSYNADYTYYYEAMQAFLTERGISTRDVPGSAYSSATIGYYIENLKVAASDPRITAYSLDYNYDTWNSIIVSGSTYNYKNGSTVSLDNKSIFGTVRGTDLGATYLPRVFDIVDGDTYYGLIGLLFKLVDESTNEVDLLKKAYIIPHYDEHYGTKQEVQILLNKYATYYARDYVLDNYNGGDWAGKEGVKASLENLRFIVAMPPVPSLYKGATVKVMSFDAPTAEGQTVNGSWLPASETLIKLDAFLTESFKYDLSWGSDEFLRQCVPNSDEILALEGDEATKERYETWWYYPVGSDKNPYWASFTTNASTLDNRVGRWQQFRRGIDGIYNWVINNCMTLVYDPSTDTYAYDYSADKLNEAYILEHGTSFQNCYGEGTLLYMVKNSYGSYGVNFLSTLRLENVAEGIDDYNYLAYAEELIDGVLNEEVKATCRARFDSLFEGLFELSANDQTRTGAFTADHDDLKNARKALALLIEELLAYNSAE